MNPWIKVLVVAAGAAAGALALAQAPAAPELAATAARAQAAYFTGNAAELAKLGTATAPWAKSANPRELYTHAYVQFRALQLAIGAKRNKEASQAGEACVDALDAAVKRDPKFAEAHALQSACYGYMANLGGMGAIRNGSRSGKSVEAAAALEPRNPRVLLVEGFGVYFRPKFVGGDKGKGCDKFRAAAAVFDAAGPAGAPSTAVPSAGGIDWGAAESHYWVGRCAADADQGAVATREFERALALAPNFAAAKRAMGR